MTRLRGILVRMVFNHHGVPGAQLVHFQRSTKGEDMGHATPKNNGKWHTGFIGLEAVNVVVIRPME